MRTKLVHSHIFLNWLHNTPDINLDDFFCAQQSLLTLLGNRMVQKKQLREKNKEDKNNLFKKINFSYISS